MIKMPVSFEQFSKDPIKAMLFIVVCVVLYLYVDNKTAYQNQIVAERETNKKQEIRIKVLEDKVDTLTLKLIDCAKYMKNE
jgi:hypothetical protein